jgi:hypothetical protein
MFTEKNDLRKNYLKNRRVFRDKLKKRISIYSLKKWNDILSRNKKILLLTSNKRDLIKVVSHIKHYWFKKPISSFFNFFKKLAYNKLFFNNFFSRLSFLGLILKKSYDKTVIGKYLLTKVNLLSYITAFKKLNNNYYSNNLFVIGNLRLKLLFNFFIKYLPWRYLPQWLIVILKKIVKKYRYRLKKKIMSYYLRNYLKRTSLSFYTNSYLSMVSNFLYRGLLNVVTTMAKIDLQKYSKQLVKIQYIFIGGVTLTPMVLLRYLLFKLAKLHLPTEMIPKMLYKFNGFFKKTIDGENKDKQIIKYVRAFSPFIKGLLFKCNGRFTRKQDVSTFTF